MVMDGRCTKNSAKYCQFSLPWKVILLGDPVNLCDCVVLAFLVKCLSQWDILVSFPIGNSSPWWIGIIYLLFFLKRAGELRIFNIKKKEGPEPLQHTPTHPWFFACEFVITLALFSYKHFTVNLKIVKKHIVLPSPFPTKKAIKQFQSNGYI